MTEFMDFLRHEIAYVAIGEFKPGKFEEAQRLYEKAVLTYKEGFKGAYLLQIPGTDKGIAVIFWETVQDMNAHETEAHQKILEEMGPLFATTPNTAVYEVVNKHLPEKEESAV